MIRLIGVMMVLCLLSGCVAGNQYRQKSNVELGYNGLCLGVDGKIYTGDPFAPVENNQGCTRHNVQPMFE